MSQIFDGKKCDISPSNSIPPVTASVPCTFASLPSSLLEPQLNQEKYIGRGEQGTGALPPASGSTQGSNPPYAITLTDPACDSDF